VIHAPRPRDPSFPSITVAGFVATIAQVLLLRELLVLLHGNEMSTGLALAGWLLWTSLGSGLAAWRSGRGVPRESTLGLLLMLLAVALPGLVLVVRGARDLFAIPAGELVPVGKMVLVCLSVPSLFGLIGGALFGLCWAHRRGAEADGSPERPLAIYLGEAVGAAAGGIVFYFLLLRVATALSAAVAVALLPLGVSGWILWTRLRRERALTLRLLWSFAAVALVVVAVAGDRLEERSRWWLWGEDLALARDTPFHNIAILRQPDQVTVFTNGLWLFTQPDPASAETAVHPALLQHPRPRRVLLIGGGLAGHVEEALKHPSIEAVDYVEQDPELILQSQEFLTVAVRDSLRDPRLRTHHEDAATFLRRRADRYDVILMNLGDPINAQMNRFFTVEMFRLIEGHLLPGGILSFSVPGGGDMIGPAHARYLSSMNRTLGEVFSEVAVLPGGRARFFAAREAGSLVLDPRVLGGRIGGRGLDLAHVREDTLQDLMNPFRLDYARTLLSEFGSSPVNRQFAPICYLHSLRLWAAQWHPGLERILGAAASVRPLALSTGLAVFGVLVILFFWVGRPRYRVAVGASVFVQGAVGMVVQIVLILTFQILQGFAYLQLALIIALFMAGLAVGTLWITAVGRWQERDRAIRWFTPLQAAVTLFPLALLVFFSPAGQDLREALSPAAASWAFSSASLVAGVLGGAHFSLAALASAAAGGRLERAGGYLYAADLTGAAGGAFAAGLVVLPLYGVPNTLILLSLSSLVCLVAILRRPR
jgi:spermidine synthase